MDFLIKLRSSILFTVMALASAMVPEPMLGQNPVIVFEGSYQRNFRVLNCSNTNPIVVTIQAPAADDPLSYIPLETGQLVTIFGAVGNTNCNVLDQEINLLTPTTFNLVGIVGNGAYSGNASGFISTISDPTPSVPMQNRGQVGHLISVEFPDAVADVTPIQVRIETAYDCPDPPFCQAATWRPISPDVVTVVEQFGTLWYAFQRANGAWRAIRVNSLVATPGAQPMKVNYTGTASPLGLLSVVNNTQVIGPIGASPTELEFVAGACQNGGAALAFNGGTTDALPEAQCIDSAQELAVAAFDDTATECVQDSWRQPDVSPPQSLQLDILWQAANVGTVQWSVQFACVEMGDPLGSAVFGTAVTGTAANMGANELGVTSLTGIDLVGCPSGAFNFFRFCRVGGVGTLTGDALVKSLEFFGAVP